MDENVGKDAYPPEQKKDSFEVQKDRARSILLDRSLQFVDWDLRINNMVEDLFSTIIGEVKRDPKVLFSSRGDNLETLVDMLKKRSESGKGNADISGGDIIGGAGFGDIIDFIDKIGDLAADEKKFFLKIIFLIFCDCDCVCKCLCD